MLVPPVFVMWMYFKLPCINAYFNLDRSRKSPNCAIGNHCSDQQNQHYESEIMNQVARRNSPLPHKPILEGFDAIFGRIKRAQPLVFFRSLTHWVDHGRRGDD